MKIRLMGSPQEVESGIQRIKEIFPVISISREYPNRNSADVRVYMEVIQCVVKPLASAMGI